MICVGSRVRIIAPAPAKYVGKTGYVGERYQGQGWFVDIDGDGENRPWIYDYELEEIEGADPRKDIVDGSRVRIGNDKYVGLFAGREGIVHDCGGTYIVSVRFDDGMVASFYRESIILLDKPAQQSLPFTNAAGVKFGQCSRCPTSTSNVVDGIGFVCCECKYKVQHIL